MIILHLFPSLTSSKNMADACYVKLNQNSAGKYVLLLAAKTEVGEGEEKKQEITDVGYVAIGRRNDSDFAYLEAEKESATVIYAFYYDNELVDANSQVVEVTNGGFTEEFTTKANVAYDSVKAFIWDGLTTMTPLAVAVSYPAE